MIYSESKKLNLIASLIKESNDEVLMQVEKILTGPPVSTSGKFVNFLNRLTDNELQEFEKTIEDGCEQINDNDWK